MKIGLVYADALGAGGYPRDVRWLATALQSRGSSVSLFTSPGNCREGLDSRITVMPVESVLHAEADVFHVFGIFIPRQIRLLSRLLRRDSRVILSPMGHLMPLHLKRHALRKQIYLVTIRPFLRGLGWLHSFSSEETRSIEQYWNHGTRCFEASLGVFPSPCVSRGKRDASEDLRVLFFGRNDVYQKGIDILLAGAALAIQRGARLHLMIAGQPWGDSEQFIRKFIDEEGIHDSVRLVGPVNDETRWQLLSHADYLAFLSRWDGPPRPIREAISVGTPVIVSPETNMGQLVEQFNAGMQVSLNSERVAEALQRIASIPDLRLRHSEGAKQLKDRLQWERVADDYIHGYRMAIASSGTRS